MACGWLRVGLYRAAKIGAQSLTGFGFSNLPYRFYLTFFALYVFALSLLPYIFDLTSLASNHARGARIKALELGIVRSILEARNCTVAMQYLQ